MKKAALILAVIMIVCSFAACGQKEEEIKEEKTEAVWVLNADETLPNASEEALDALNKALEDYTGMGFECIAQVGSQVVAGQNLMFLCKGTPVVPDAEAKLVMVIVYRDLSDVCTVTAANDFDLKALEAAGGEGTPGGLAGGWTVISDYTVVNLPAEAQSALQAVSETAEPLALLASDENGDYAVLAIEDGQLETVFLYADGEAKTALVNLSEYSK